MRASTKQPPLSRNKWYQLGVPMDREMKKNLRNRSNKLNAEQLDSLKTMGIKLSSSNTEKEAVKLAKRVCKYHYQPAPSGIKKAKPGHINKREHLQNVLIYAAKIQKFSNDDHNWVGSNRARKRLARGGNFKG